MNRLVATLLALVVSSACLWGQSVKSEDVFIQAGDDVLKGTLSHVKQARKSPKALAIILAGSGPTDRHGNGTGPSLLFLYQHLNSTGAKPQKGHLCSRKEGRQNKQESQQEKPH